MSNDEKMPFNQTMTEAEQIEALRLLKEAIKRGVIRYEHADPIKQNCYISSSYIEGLYFPNTSFYLTAEKHTFYNVCAIAKINYNLCLVYSLKDDTPDNLKEHLKEFTSDTLESLIYSYEERQILSELNKRIKEHKSELETLTKIKRVYKKNGEDFALLSKCFEGYYSFYIGRSWFNGEATEIKINGVSLWRSDEARKQSREPSAEEVEALICQYIQTNKDYINKYERAKKTTRQNYLKMSKLVNTCKAFFDTLQNGEYYIFKKQFKDMI